MVVGFYSFSFFSQGRLQWLVAEFPSGKILALVGRIAQRKVMFKIPGFYVLCSVLWEPPELQQLLQEYPDRNMIKSPAPEMLCSPELVMIWKWRKRVQPGSMHSLRGYFRHWGINWGNGMEKNPPAKGNSQWVLWLLHLTCGMSEFLDGCAPCWCALWPHRLAKALEHMEIVLLCPFLLHHIHCRAGSGVVQGRRSPWLSHAENQAPYPRLLCCPRMRSEGDWFHKSKCCWVKPRIPFPWSESV